VQKSVQELSKQANPDGQISVDTRGLQAVAHESEACADRSPIADVARPGKSKKIQGAIKCTISLTAVLCLGAMWFGWMAPVLADNPPKAPTAEPSSRLEPIRPIPLVTAVNPEKAALGERLFHDPRLSGDGNVSCASCHDLALGGTDQRKYSAGVNGALGSINAPTVFNSAGNFRQFWDGRAATLEEQIDGPIHAKAEMGSSWQEIIPRLQEAPEYAAAFRSIYSGTIQPAHVKDAIAEFERSLTTPNSRFDQYLRGDGNAITADEKEGYRKFKSYGCVSCHQGVNVGGNMFATLGAMDDYFAERGNVDKADYGRFNVTGKEEDRFVFKVPSLRNVALTAPYLHDGSAKTLDRAVAIMGRFQLGRHIPPEDLELIVKFLETLTGQYKGKSL
jgi:cytochrome c peroxidase